MTAPLLAAVGPLEVLSEREARRVSRCPECGATLAVHTFQMSRLGSRWVIHERTLPARFVPLSDGSYGTSHRAGRGGQRISDLAAVGRRLGLPPIIEGLTTLPIQKYGTVNVSLPAVIHCPTATCGGRRIRVDTVRANG